MNRRKWNWWLVVGLMLALFMVKAPVEGGNNGPTLNVTGIGYPMLDIDVAYIYGTATYTGAPPTFEVELTEKDTQAIYHSSVLATTWITSTSWKLTIDTSGIPDGQYLAEVTANFSTGQTRVDNSFSGGEPDCLNLVCVPGP
jgi:hypothetical protein